MTTITPTTTTRMTTTMTPTTTTTTRMTTTMTTKNNQKATAQQLYSAKLFILEYHAYMKATQQNNCNQSHTHTPNRSHVGVVRVHELQESQDTLSSCISSLISSTFISSLTIARHQVGIREHCVRRFIRHGLRPNPRRDHTPHMGGTYERL